ncbi:MORN repeat protein [Leptospira wolffii]|uniref:MORN repeat protein n=1 Tax=Leptospira wolffii TaxID=409998 RepID=UPI0003087BC8|nr:MORN repeat protein [Leptospira wolffii]EPG65630.1 MORN repeat protein [Leptospira wolffii serovar Khorat str. Khorat-H2]
MNKTYYPLILLPLLAFGAYYYLSPECSQGDCKNGFGIESLPGRYRFEGEFKNGLAHGKGRLELANGEYYEGEWKNGIKEGRGLQRFSDGRYYEGFWKENKENGKGILKNSDGVVLFEGEWKEGKAAAP